MILAPFKWIVALFFNWSQTLFNDPGWAVVGMSVLLSLLLTPLYVWIERRKNSDKAKSAPMQAEIDKIEAVYKGRERYYYTREIQRRYRYSPWTAMIPTLGLLVQIPFLLAAYHYLSELPLFNGISFGYIKDLSKPDTIAVVAGLPINLLAILMTVINLVSGWRYAESGKPKERIQYMSVAAIFLFLLYNCAASVVLYWTLSNALSFVRSEIFFRKREETAPATAKTWSCVHVQVFSSWFFILALALAGYCFCVSAALPSSVSARALIAAVDDAGVLMLLLAWTCFAVWRAFEQRRDGAHGGSSSVLGRWQMRLVALFLLLVVLDRFTLCPLGESQLLSYFSVRAWRLMGVVIAVGFACQIPSVLKLVSLVRLPTCTRASGFASLAAFLYVACVILIWHPLLVYASEPQSFATSAWGIVGKGLGWAAAIGVGFILAWKMFLKRLAAVLTTVGLVFVGFVVLTYLFILPFDVGTLQGAELVNLKGMFCTGAEYLLEGIGLVTLLFVAIMLVAKLGSKGLAATFVVLHLVVIIQAGGKILSHGGAGAAVARASEGVEPIKLSRTGHNIVVFMLDMVQGHSFHHVQDDPELARHLTGFTWFPNAVSIANMTCPSMPAVYGGPDFAPDKLNLDDRPLNVKASEIMRNFKTEFEKRGFAFRHYNCNLAVFGNELTRISPLFDRKYLSGVMGRPDYHGKSGMLGILRANALMQAVPFALKPMIYNNGKWRGCSVPGESYRSFSQEHLFYEALPRITQACESGSGGNLNFFHVEATHNPWGIPSGNGKIVRADNVQMLKWIMRQLGAYFEWMKRNGVYDNTRIILVSDHGLVNMEKDTYKPENDPMQNKQLWAKLVGDLQPQWVLQDQKIQMLNCLMAVKDFDDQGPFRRSDLLVSNADVRGLLESEKFADMLHSLPSVRDAYIVRPPSGGVGFQELKTMEVLVHFKIRNSVFDLMNWERVK